MSTTSVSRAEGVRAPSTAALPPTMGGGSRRAVDAPTRTFHLLFALSFAGAYLTGESESWKLLHITLGYTLVGLLGFRSVWGLLGPRSVRWSAWAGRLRGWPQAKADLRSGNLVSPAVQGVTMVTTLVGMLAATVLALASGWITDAELTGDWISEVHEAAGSALLALVMLHVGLVAGWSLLRQRNLATPMWTGRIPGQGPDLVAHDRRWLAIVMVACVVGFWGYMAVSSVFS